MKEGNFFSRYCLLMTNVSISWYQIAFVVFCLVYFLAAYLNVGYFHPDEHYQLIEFAGLKLGWNTSADLAWEFRSMIRPTLQVWLCIWWFKLLQPLGIVDPYSLAFSLRLLTAVFALFSITFFYRASKSFLDTKYHFIYYVLSFLLWFVPLVSVRFSSETWSGLCFLLAFSLSIGYRSSRWSGILIGTAMALSFLFRFQSGILIMSLCLWLVLIEKKTFNFMLGVMFSLLLIIQLGILLDTLFYGKYVLAFWNYFDVNIIQGVASNFGTSPGSTILDYIAVYTLWPLGLLIVVAFLVMIWKSPCSPFLWCTVPFIVIHTVIPHKEVRFLFPIIWFVPAILMLAFQHLEILLSRIPHVYKKMSYLLVLAIPLAFINCYALAIAVTKPAGFRQKALTKTIDETYRDRPIRLIHTKNGNPYAPWPGLKENFYRNPAVSFTRIDFPFQVRGDRFSFSADTIYLLAMRSYESKAFIEKNIKLIPVCLDTGYLSAWLEKGLDKYIGVHRTSGFEIYEIKTDMP